MLMPEFLKVELDAKLTAELARHADLNEAQRNAVRNMAYGIAQAFIDTHAPGPYPSWGEGHAHILAGNCVDQALMRLRRMGGDVTKL